MVYATQSRIEIGSGRSGMAGPRTETTAQALDNLVAAFKRMRRPRKVALMVIFLVIYLVRGLAEDAAAVKDVRDARVLISVHGTLEHTCQGSGDLVLAGAFRDICGGSCLDPRSLD